MGELQVENQRVMITGGAGVIGSEMVHRLSNSNEITVVDNLSSGKFETIQTLALEGKIKFIRGDVRDFQLLKNEMSDISVVFHFAAQGDARYRPTSPTDLDLNINTIGMYNVLEAMRINDVSELVFSSSSTVYGNAIKIPTPEDYGPLIPTSLYGASKLASEGLIGGFSELFGINAWIYRFANIVAPKSRKVGKNVIPDFVYKLLDDPSRLQILGSGKQEKSYLYIDDCIDGMLTLMGDGNRGVNIYNLGAEDTITVDEIARIIVEKMGLNKAVFEHTGGKGGWKGDVPLMFLDIKKAKEAGWKPKHTSSEAVTLSAEGIIQSLIRQRKSS